MKIKIVFLGCRAPSPTINGFTSIAILINGEVVLLDAGEGTQKYLTLAKLSLGRVNKIFITHLHGDHVLGLIPLMESRSLIGIQKELTIYGPPSIKEYVERNLELLKFTPNYKYEVVEGIDLRVEGVKYIIETFPVNHSVTTLGVKIKTSNHLIVYSSDTTPCDSLIRNATNADILIHDSTYSYIDSDKAQTHMHSTSVDAANTAVLSGAKTLVLTHISTRYRDVSRLEREAKAKFFNTLLAEELMTIYL